MSEENLDLEFQDYITKFDCYINYYDFREKFLLSEWLAKLKSANSNLAEKQLRNRFIKFFVDSQNAKTNLFIESPFNVIPKEFAGALNDLKYLLPKTPEESITPNEDEKRAYISNLFNSLADEGKFLSQQPIPRHGTFSIFVLKSDEEESCTNNEQ